jgi:hypothetical protein
LTLQITIQDISMQSPYSARAKHTQPWVWSTVRKIIAVQGVWKLNPGAVPFLDDTDTRGKL